MKMLRNPGIILALLGAMLLIGSSVYGMVILEILEDFASVPEDGGVYSTLTKVSITTPTELDGEPVSKVVYYQDGAKVGALPTIAPPPSLTWGTNIDEPTEGSHTFKFEIYVGLPVGSATLQSTVSGSFTMEKPVVVLQGHWYVNNKKIVSSGDTISTIDRTVSFKFVKTQGVRSLTATVSWTGPETGSKTLSTSDDITWQGSHTFGAYGTYTVDLVADDGEEQIVMSVVGWIGSEGFGFPLQSAVQGFGVLLIVVGGLFLIARGIKPTKRKRRLY